MMPLSHSTLAGQFDDFDGPSDCTPGVASLKKSLRNWRRYWSEPPPTVVRSADEKAEVGTLPLTMWCLTTSAVILPPLNSKSAITSSVGAKTVYSPDLRSDSSFIGFCRGPSEPQKISGPCRSASESAID